MIKKPLSSALKSTCLLNALYDLAQTTAGITEDIAPAIKVPALLNSPSSANQSANPSKKNTDKAINVAIAIILKKVFKLETKFVILIYHI